MGKFIKISHEDWKLINKEIESYSKAEGLKLDPDDIGVYYDDELEGMAESYRLPDKGIYIALRPGLSKSQLRAYVRHEMGHIKQNLQGFGFSREVREYEEVDSLARRELLALLEEGGISFRELTNLMIWLVEDRGFSPGEAVKAVSEEARGLDIPFRRVKEAKDLFWDDYR